jgi:hypothetical protein
VATHSQDPHAREEFGPGDGKEPLDADLRTALNRLDRYTERLRRAGSLVVGTAIATLVFLIGNGILRVLPFRSPARLIAAFGGMLVALLGIQLLLVWDRCRREGMAVYEEISDEVEWRHRTFRKDGPEGQESRGNKAILGVRLDLRRFLTNTELPFAPGSNASTIYVLYFIFTIVCFVMILILSDPGLTF